MGFQLFQSKYEKKKVQAHCEQGETKDPEATSQVRMERGIGPLSEAQKLGVGIGIGISQYIDTDMRNMHIAIHFTYCNIYRTSIFNNFTDKCFVFLNIST